LFELFRHRRSFTAVADITHEHDRKFLEARISSITKIENFSILDKFDEIDENLRTVLPVAYSTLTTQSPIEKWYFRALGLFKAFEQTHNVTIMTIYPFDHIEVKSEILSSHYMILPND
jgi:hypothetical protein